MSRTISENARLARRSSSGIDSAQPVHLTQLARPEPLRHRGHARKVDHHAGEPLVDLDDLVDPVRTEPSRGTAGQALLDEHDTIAEVDDELVPWHRQTPGLQGVQQAGHRAGIPDPTLEDRHHAGANVRPLHVDAAAELSRRRPPTNGQSRAGGAVDRVHQVCVGGRTSLSTSSTRSQWWRDFGCPAARPAAGVVMVPANQKGGAAVRRHLDEDDAAAGVRWCSWSEEGEDADN